MNIGIDGHMLGDNSGGNERYFRNVLSFMNINSEDKVYLFVKPQIDVTDFEKKYIIVRFSVCSSFYRNFVELNKLCKKYRIDVLHTQCFIPFFRSYRVVCTIHDICFEHFGEFFTKKDYIIQKLLIPYAAKHSDYIFTVSRHAQRDIANCYGVDQSRILVTYNAVGELFRVVDEDVLDLQELKERYSICATDYILTVGNLQPRKNLPRLIKAFNDWKRENKQDIQLVVVGKKAWMYSDILRAAGSECENIVFTGYVSDTDLVRLYNGARAFIYPSIFEGFGIPPLEAMACGTPVAVSKTSSLPEVVGEAGLYFNPFCINEIKESIEILVNNNIKREEIIKKESNQLKKFSWSSSAKIIMDTYHRC